MLDIMTYQRHRAIYQQIGSSALHPAASQDQNLCFAKGKGDDSQPIATVLLYSSNRSL